MGLYHGLDCLALQKSNCCVSPVNHHEPVHLFGFHHLGEDTDDEFLVAAVDPRLERDWRLDAPYLDIALSLPFSYISGKDSQAMLRSPLEQPKMLDHALQSIDHILLCRCRFDIDCCALLLAEVIDDLIHVIACRNIHRNQLGMPAPMLL